LLFLCEQVSKNINNAFHNMLPLFLIERLEFVSALSNILHHNVNSSIDVALVGLGVGPENVGRFYSVVVLEEVPGEGRPHERVEEVPPFVFLLEDRGVHLVQDFVVFFASLFVFADDGLDLVEFEPLEALQ